MRLIDADALTDELAVIAYTHDCLGILEAINNAPTIDAEPVVHGEWKWRRGGECSECGYHNGNFDFNYCPNCGAKMERREPCD